MTKERKSITVADWAKITRPHVDQMTKDIVKLMTETNDRLIEMLPPKERDAALAEQARRKALTPAQRKAEDIANLLSDLNAEYLRRRESILAGTGDPNDENDREDY